MSNVDHGTLGTTTLSRVLIDENNQPSGGVYGDNELLPQSAFFKTTTLTSAQIKALFTTPITLVPAPTAGHFIVVKAIVFNYTFATAAFANGGGGDVDFFYDTGSDPIVTAGSVTALVTAGASAITKLASLDSTILAGKAVVISKATANFTGGNAASTMGITVFYEIV